MDEEAIEAHEDSLFAQVLELFKLLGNKGRKSTRSSMNTKEKKNFCQLAKKII